MKSISKFVGAVVAGLVATSGVAFAGLNLLPEPSSIGLVGVALVGVIAVALKKKKK